ncbi:hypothetical protein AAVH_18891 [Aphelenchoides avenae]|nr:hypothetical protein AAVH_18891 [Aphelenchus avenae]
MRAKENWDAIDRVFIEEVDCRWGTKLDSGLDMLQWLEVADRMACGGAMLRPMDAAHGQHEEVNAVIESGPPSSWHLFTRVLFLSFPEKAQALEVYNVRVG